jgi:hypothetical protein
MIVLEGVAIIVGTVAAAVAGMLLVRRSVALSTLEVHNDVAGFIYAVIGVVYAVLLAFMVIVVWERYDAAETRVNQEAGTIIDIYRDAQAFEDPFRTDVRAQLQRYAESVVGTEWDSMSVGHGSQPARTEFDRLWTVYATFEPVTQNDREWYGEVLDRLNTVSDYRQLRIRSASARLPVVLWLVLITGAAITIAFTYFFGTRSVSAHLLMVIALALTLALALFLIWALERPFGGFVRIRASAFHDALAFMRGWRTPTMIR